MKFCAQCHAHFITWQTYLKELLADIDVNIQSLVESNEYEVSLVCNMLILTTVLTLTADTSYWIS
jgi:hypothetical protein